MGVSKKKSTKKWMVYKGKPWKPLLKIDDLGGKTTLFLATPIFVETSLEAFFPSGSLQLQPSPVQRGSIDIQTPKLRIYLDPPNAPKKSLNILIYIDIYLAILCDLFGMVK